MADDEEVRIALLRGINVGGNRKVPMAELRGLAAQLGWQDVESYIQSGNLVFRSAGTAAAAEAALEEALQGRFGFSVDVVVRSAGEWRRFASGSPFPDAEQERPNLLHLALPKAPPQAGALERLRPYAKAGERIELRDEALWIDFVGGVAKSRLTPGVLERVVGSTVTARNWRTVQKLAEMARALGSVP